MSSGDRSLDTILAQAGHTQDRETGAVVPPLHTGTTFARDPDLELVGDFIYSRYSSPTVELAERVLAELEGGSDALLFTSGQAAAAAILETLGEGDRVVAPRVMYHGIKSWLRRIADRRGVRLELFDAGDPQALPRILSEGGAGMVWIESPVNPTWDVIDIEGAARVAKKVGARLVVDQTVAPLTTRALDLGADVVFHSVTKYIGGHSDLLGGAVVTRPVDPWWEELKSVRTLSGGIMGGSAAWLLLRSIRTLGVRFDRCSATADTFARHFVDHAEIEAVLYPGLESHPGHEVARRQMRRGFGGMLSILVAGDAARARAVAGRLQIFTRATSLGGVESLVEHRASVEGPDSVVPGNLLRLSIGLENPADLVADLEQALAGA